MQAEQAAAREQQSQQRVESVAKIMEEFDDLRNAADTEIKAMRDLMQAEKDLRDAMKPAQRPVYPRPYPGYYPYYQYPAYPTFPYPAY
jgi:hypothetical protein